MSRYLPIAVVFTEDTGFFRKSGFNPQQIRFALTVDLKEARFARGASTLTMQVAKNLFLSRDKTVSRKLEEVILTEYLAQRFSKDEILELYLNLAEFGPDLYGVKAAARHYFGKSPASLTFPEALFLAAMLPSPVRLHALKTGSRLADAYADRIDYLMGEAAKAGLVSEAEVEEQRAHSIVFAPVAAREAL